MTQLSGNKCRVHTRHGAHGSVCVSAVVLPAGANPQIRQCGPEVFARHAGLRDEPKVLRWQGKNGDFACSSALLGTLSGLL